MKSKITVEIDHDNQPIIQIKYEPSDDVRDNLVKRFLETFCGDSCWAKFQFVAHGTGDSISKLRPISVKDIKEEAKVMKAWSELLVEQYEGADIPTTTTASQ